MSVLKSVKQICLSVCICVCTSPSTSLFCSTDLCLLFQQFHTVRISVPLHYALKSDSVSPQTLFFKKKLICFPCIFQKQLDDVYKMPAQICSGSRLNLQNDLGRSDILTKSHLLIHAYCMYIHFIISLFSLVNVLQFLGHKSWICLQIYTKGLHNFSVIVNSTFYEILISNCTLLLYGNSIYFSILSCDLAYSLISSSSSLKTLQSNTR